MTRVILVDKGGLLTFISSVVVNAMVVPVLLA